MSERGGPVHSYTVRAHHHDGSGGSERAAPNRNTPLAWRVQGVAPNEGNGQGKDRGSGSGALNRARARAGTGSARTAQKNQTRCMPDLHEWVEHGQSHGGHSVTWDSPLTQGSSVSAQLKDAQHAGKRQENLRTSFAETQNIRPTPVYLSRDLRLPTAQGLHTQHRAALVKRRRPAA